MKERLTIIEVNQSVTNKDLQAVKFGVDFLRVNSASTMEVEDLKKRVRYIETRVLAKH